MNSGKHCLSIGNSEIKCRWSKQFMSFSSTVPTTFKKTCFINLYDHC